MKVLVVGDLHLRERELATTKGMILASRQMLEGIEQTLLNDEEIKLVFFLGDIQHDTPKSQRTLRETTVWKAILGRIGNIITERMPKTIIIPREELETDEDNTLTDNLDLSKTLPSKALPLFSLVGNHDVELRMKGVAKGYNYTFFDDLMYTGILQNPRGVIFKDSGRYYYFQLNNYGEANAPIPQKVIDLDPSIVKIKLLHDTVELPDSPSWYGFLSEDEKYKGEEILGDCHIAICGHIHQPLPPTQVQGNGTLGDRKTVFLQTGAMGRTSIADENMRDYGYCTIVDTTNGLKLESLHVPLMSKEEYFDWKQINLSTRKKELIMQGKSFNLTSGRDELNLKDPKEDLRAMEIDKDVKNNCIRAIEIAEGTKD